MPEITRSHAQVHWKADSRLATLSEKLRFPVVDEDCRGLSLFTRRHQRMQATLYFLVNLDLADVAESLLNEVKEYVDA